MNTISKNTRFSSDITLYDALMNNKTIRVLAEKRRQEANDDSYRRSLLGQGLRISASIAPELHEQIQVASKKLGLHDKNIEVYIYNSPEPNATCAILADGRIILTFSSGLLQSMNNDEINFVVGHELGHALFNHASLPTHGILNDSAIDASDAMRLMSWSRRAEISADRTGLYVCENPEAAISAFLKLSCGVAAPVISFDIKEYANQIKDLGDLANNLEDTSHCYSSHPFNPIRVMAVDLYSRSQPYLELTNQPITEDTLDIESLDNEINTVLAFMEPTPDEERQRLLNECLFWAGAWVAYADGELVASEAANLRDQVGETLFDSYIDELETSDTPLELAKSVFDVAVVPIKNLPAPEKCALIQRLVVIARADQNIDERELDALHHIARHLKIDASFVQQILIFLQ
ncbi:Protease HtpX [BD1-7 clade bacterium]|uniref:Protease HtpX n=1 Tax=BD1-7 clade bacterium TaxID=2029982 RepID=A0A5S9Q7G0_9GAMM|nr:Protease HtpX [BD1-7 clade bacterium]CAA0113902.1 Protease HtpX [BD1-7 clade bacterium]